MFKLMLIMLLIRYISGIPINRRLILKIKKINQDNIIQINDKIISKIKIVEKTIEKKTEEKIDERIKNPSPYDIVMDYRNIKW